MEADLTRYFALAILKHKARPVGVLAGHSNCDSTCAGSTDLKL